MVKELIETIESEMVAMWALGEVPGVIKHDPDFISMILQAVYVDMEHYRALGMIIGES